MAYRRSPKDPPLVRIRLMLTLVLIQPTISTMENNSASNSGNTQPPPNPPSIEAAYKRKCIELKKRLSEIEAANDAMRARNAQGHRYIQKMRLESCMLLERLAVLTGM